MRLPGLLVILVFCNLVHAQTSCLDFELVTKLSNGNLPFQIASNSSFGLDVATIGDLDMDGVEDIAVGISRRNNRTDGGFAILFMNSDFTVKSAVINANGENNFAGTFTGAVGKGLCAIGDVNGDGIQDLALSEPRSSLAVSNDGRVWVMFMNRDGSVKDFHIIDANEPNLGYIPANEGRLGAGLAPLGDFDGDNIPDLAIGAIRTGSANNVGNGSVFITLLNNDGSVKRATRIGNEAGGFTGDLSGSNQFGDAVGGAVDLNGDSIRDILVGDRTAIGGGGFWAIYLNEDGTVLNNIRYSSVDNNLPFELAESDRFGSEAEIIGDVDGNGFQDYLIGSHNASDGGAAYLLFIGNDNKVVDFIAFNSLEERTEGNIESGDNLGWSGTFLSDLDADGNREIIIGAHRDDDGGVDAGALYIFESSTDGKLDVNLGPDKTSCDSTLILSAPIDDVDYLWSTGETTQSIEVALNGEYCVTVMDSNGCDGEDCVVVIFEDCSGCNEKSFARIVGNGSLAGSIQNDMIIRDTLIDYYLQSTQLDNGEYLFSSKNSDGASILNFDNGDRILGALPLKGDSLALYFYKNASLDDRNRNYGILDLNTNELNYVSVFSELIGFDQYPREVGFVIDDHGNAYVADDISLNNDPSDSVIVAKIDTDLSVAWRINIPLADMGLRSLNHVDIKIHPNGSLYLIGLGGTRGDFANRCAYVIKINTESGNVEKAIVVNQSSPRSNGTSRSQSFEFDQSDNLIIVKQIENDDKIVSTLMRFTEDLEKINEVSLSHEEGDILLNDITLAENQIVLGGSIGGESILERQPILVEMSTTLELTKTRRLTLTDSGYINLVNYTPKTGLSASYVDFSHPHPDSCHVGAIFFDCNFNLSACEESLAIRVINESTEMVPVEVESIPIDIDPEFGVTNVSETNRESRLACCGIQIELGSDTTVCNGTIFSKTIEATVSLNDVSYLWNTGATTSTITVSEPGEYSVIVTNDEGCIGMDTLLIMETITRTVQERIETCEDFVVLDYTLEGNPNSASYEWSDGVKTPNRTVEQAGEYCLRVELDGCSDEFCTEVEFVEECDGCIQYGYAKSLGNVEYFNTGLNKIFPSDFDIGLYKHSKLFGGGELHFLSNDGKYLSGIDLSSLSVKAIDHINNDSIVIYSYGKDIDEFQKYLGILEKSTGNFTYTNIDGLMRFGRGEPEEVGFLVDSLGTTYVAEDLRIGDSAISIRISKVHVNLNVEWVVEIPIESQGFFAMDRIDIIENNEELFLLGSGSSFDESTSEIVLLKLNSENGELLVSRFIDGITSFEGNSSRGPQLIIDENEDLYFFAEVFLNFVNEPVILKLNSDLEILKTVGFRTPQDRLEFNDILWVDGELIVGGSRGRINHQPLLFNLDSGLNILSAKTFDIVENGSIQNLAFSDNIGLMGNYVSFNDPQFDSVEIGMMVFDCDYDLPSCSENNSLIEFEVELNTTNPIFQSNVVDFEQVFDTLNLEFISTQFPASCCNLEINLGANLDICFGDTIVLDGTTEGNNITYLWSDGSTQPILEVTQPGTYAVTITDASGCSGFDEIIITGGGDIPVNLGDDVELCMGTKTTLQAPDSSIYTYQWSTDETTSSIEVGFEGTYSVTVSDAFGCEGTDEATVTLSGDLTVQIPDTIIQCTTCGEGGGFAITPQILSGNEPYQYEWKTATGVGGSIERNYEGCYNEDGLLYFNVTDSSGCKGGDTALVLVSPQMDAVINGRDYLCYDSCADYAAIVQSGGRTPYTYNWFNGATSQTINQCLTDSSTLTVQITDSLGCKTSAAIEVGVNKELLLNMMPSNPSFCTDECADLSATANGGTSPLLYTWSNNTSTRNAVYCEAGIATVTVTDQRGCTITDSIEVIENSFPEIEISNDTAICEGASASLKATGGSSYLWKPTADISDSTSATTFAMPKTTTSYTVFVATNEGCVDSAMVTVTVNNTFTANATASPRAVCAGESTMLTAEATGVNMPTYQWLPEQGVVDPMASTTNATVNQTTVYTLIVTDNIGCQATDTVVITAIPLPRALAGLDDTVCFGGSIQLNASGGVAYQWTPAEGLSDPTIANPIADPNETTTYVVQVTDANNCVNFDTVTLVEEALPEVSIAPSDTAFCLGGSVSLISTAPTAIQYHWSPSDGLIDSTIANPTAKPDTTTEYTLAVTDEKGCTNRATANVRVFMPSIIEAGQADTICSGDEKQLSATGGVSYVWSADTTLSDSTIANPIAAPLATSTYYVSGTDANGCTNEDSITISVFPLAFIDVGQDKMICVGDTISLFADVNEAAVSVSWSPNERITTIEGAFTQVFPLTTTNYVATVTDTNGCLNQDTVLVEVNGLPSMNALPDSTICAGDSVDLRSTPINDKFTYRWEPFGEVTDPDSSATSAFPTDSAVYTLTVTDTNNCSNSDEAIVHVKPLPLVNAGPDIEVCIGDTATLQGTGEGTLRWTPANLVDEPNSDTTLAFNTSTQLFTLTTIDNNGCQNQDSVEVEVFDNTLLNVTPRDTLICAGDTVALVSNLTEFGLQFTWEPEEAIQINNDTTVFVTPFDSTEYTITVVDLRTETCPYQDTVVINVKPTPGIIDFKRLDTICLGDTAFLNVNATGQNLKYNWSPPSLIDVPIVPNTFAEPKDTTVYYISVTDSISGCISADSITVFVVPYPELVVITPVETCFDVPLQLSVMGAEAYKWSPSLGLDSDTIANPTFDGQTSTVYTIIGANEAGCADTATMEVLVNPLPIASINGPTTVCEGDLVNLSVLSNGVPDDTYQWAPAILFTDPTAANQQFTANTSVQVSVTITDANGCTTTLDQAIEVQPGIPTVMDDVEVCASESVSLEASGGVSYTWTSQSGEVICNSCTAPPVVNPNETTTYLVMVNRTGCEPFSDLVTINIFPSANYLLSEDRIVNELETVNLTFTPQNPAIGYTLKWSADNATVSCADCETTEVVITENTQVFIKITDQNGCIVNDTINITVQNLCELIGIPNAFTPNGDNLNDVFKLESEAELAKSIVIDEFRIVNRWNKELYRANGDIETGWNGLKEDGTIHPGGVYTYFIRYSCGGQIFEETGSVLLLE